MYCISIMYLLNRLCDEDDIYRVYTVVGNKHEEDRHIPDRKIQRVVYILFNLKGY